MHEVITGMLTYLLQHWSHRSILATSTVTHVVWSVCLLVTTISCAETAEPIEMRTQASQETVYSTGVQMPPGEGVIWGNISQPIIENMEYIM